jgi:putative MATE family efflux protein
MLLFQKQRLQSPSSPASSALSPMRQRWNRRAVWSLLWPCVIEQVLAVTMGTADTVMVSAVNEASVSGVSLVDTISNLLIIAFTSLCAGGSVVASQYLGRFDEKNASAAARQLIYVTTMVAVVISLPALLFDEPLLHLIYGNLDPDVMQAAKTYFFISGISYLSLAIYTAAAALFRCMGNSRVPMLIAALVNAINIGGNAFLIYVMGWGVAGAAVSTLVSRTLAAVILMFMLTKGRRRQITLRGLSHVHFERRMIHSILIVGVPSGIEGSLFQLGKLLVFRIATTFGTAAVAANAIASTVNNVAITPGNAFGIALVTLVGQCVGAKDYEGARYYTRRLMVIVYGMVITLSILNIIFMDPIVSLFSLSPDSHKLCASFLHVLCLMSMVFWPSSFTLPNALRAAGDAKFVMYVAAISMWTIRVGGAFLGCYTLGFGPIGIWYAWTGDWVLRTSCFTTRWLRGKWKTKNVLG